MSWLTAVSWRRRKEAKSYMENPNNISYQLTTQSKMFRGKNDKCASLGSTENTIYRVVTGCFYNIRYNTPLCPVLRCTHSGGEILLLINSTQRTT